MNLLKRIINKHCIKVLSYTDYKKNQSLWIQRQNTGRTDKGTNTEQFCIKCYVDYLDIYGIMNNNLESKIKKYLNKIGTYHLETGFEDFNTGYDIEVVNNINKLMDDLI